MIPATGVYGRFLRLQGRRGMENGRTSRHLLKPEQQPDTDDVEVGLHATGTWYLLKVII